MLSAVGGCQLVMNYKYTCFESLQNIKTSTVFPTRQRKTSDGAVMSNKTIENY